MNDGTALGYFILCGAGSDLHTQDTSVCATSQVPTSSPLDRIQQYAQVTTQRGLSASVTMALANYRKFLVLSSCAVLISTRMPASEAYGVERICMWNDVTDGYCKSMLRGCQFMHKLVDNLYGSGWGVRAFELLLIWNRSPAYHSTVGHAFESGLEFLKNALCADELMANDETHSTNWTSIYAPSIIHEILGLEYVNPSSSGKFILLIIVNGVLGRNDAGYRYKILEEWKGMGITFILSTKLGNLCECCGSNHLEFMAYKK
ncbi:hypothetical protein LTR03_016353 [Friedmanniomyces endolithicus]|nr:hypothetical protein LTR03_016353 [Friedmanniomyces endolithicus]